MEFIQNWIAFLRAYPTWVSVTCVSLLAVVALLLVAFKPSLSASDLKPDPGIAGYWTGVFREYRGDKNAEDISNEIVSIKVEGSDVVAELGGAAGKRRNRTAKGQIEGDTLILHYFVNETSRVGGSAFVLKGNPRTGLLKGYWLGFDPELNKLMACPYVLGREQDTGALTKANLDWLGQSCCPSLTPPIKSADKRAS